MIITLDYRLQTQILGIDCPEITGKALVPYLQYKKCFRRGLIVFIYVLYTIHA